MFKKQLPISLVLLLTALFGDTFARFLQNSPLTSSPTNSTTGPLIATLPTQIPYNRTLGCGECVLGNYVYCINGPEQYQGATPLPQVCCQNLTSCPQASNSSWTCSSKYANQSQFMQLKVCPFDAQQCGTQILNISQSDSECLKLRTVKKGTACLYTVNSQCVVPNLKLNDTSSNIFYQQQLISNTTISVAPVPQQSCTRPQIQSCLCRTVQNVGANSTSVTTSLVCDCQTVFNQTFSAGQCTTQTYTDVMGNQAFQAQCSVQMPTQYFQDQECNCQRSSSSGQSTLQCSSCGTATGANQNKTITLQNNQCNCVNATDAFNKTYLSCVCNNVPQCQDPKSFPIQTPPAPNNISCNISYPCNCAGSLYAQQLSCNCTNPSSNITAQITNSASNCQCQSFFNNRSMTWGQNCQCCLADDFVRNKMINPVVCQGPSPLKEACQCLNTTTGLFCNCTHPNNVTYNNISFPQNGACDSTTVTLGVKSANCCVPIDIQIIQQQPICPGNNTEVCQCNSSAGIQTCQCTNKQNGLTFRNLTLTSSSCYCNPQLGSCNCCVTPSQFQQQPPQCDISSNKLATNCNCSNLVNGTYSCNCINRYFLNSVQTGLTFRNRQCACYQQANSSLPNACQCCANQTDVVQQVQCQAGQSTQVSCNGCRPNSLGQQNASVTCAICNGGNFLNASVAVQGTNLTYNLNQCTCLNSNLSNVAATRCVCCANNNQWSTVNPVCDPYSANSQNCLCGNQTTFVNQTQQQMRNVTQLQNVTCRRTGCSGEICSRSPQVSSCNWFDAYACYNTTGVCAFQPSLNDCGWTNTTNLTQCLAKPVVGQNPRLYQNITRRQNTTQLVNVTVSQLANVTVQVPHYNWGCTCNSSKYPNFRIPNAPVTQGQCGCQPLANSSNSNCSCCLSNFYIDTLYLSNFTCPANSSNSNMADCLCTFGGNMTCNCAPRSFQSLINYRSITVDRRNCQCTNNTLNSAQVCVCCIGQMQSFVPRGPQCSVNQTSQPNCTCTEQFSPNTNRSNWNCRCSNNVTTLQNFTQQVASQVNTTMVNSTFNSTTNKTTNVTYNVTKTVYNYVIVQQNVSSIQTSSFLFTSQQCACLNYTNGSMSMSRCSCCSNNPVPCNPNTTAMQQDCQCMNLTNATTNTQGWNCSCYRKDLNFVGQLTFNQNNQCNCNPADLSCQCCVSQSQLSTQVPILQCSNSSIEQACSCRNLSGQLNCSCLRSDNGIRGNFQFTNDQCLCLFGNLSGCQCCVSQQQAFNQIPRKSCPAQGQQPQFCSCQNITSSQRNGSNITNSTVLSCNCSLPQFLQPVVQFNYSSSTSNQCLCTGGSRCECCLTTAQIAQMIPQPKCQSTDQLLNNCSCTNVTNTTSNQIQQNCTCGLFYQGSSYSISNLTSQNNGCVCNGTTCGCCLSLASIYALTERQCSSFQTKSVCQTCNLVNSSAAFQSYNCIGCSAQTPNFIVNNQVYNSISTQSCLCRAPGQNCTCCLSQSPQALVAPQCNAVTPAIVNNCQCNQSANSSYQCNCANVTYDSVRNRSVETYFNNLTMNQCSCQNVSRYGFTQTSFLQCSCCASVNQTTLQQPVCLANSTVQQCSCSGQRGCTCNYNNTMVLLNNSQNCTCPNNNQTVKQCSCCVQLSQFINAVTPQCSIGNPLSACACTNFTFGGKPTSLNCDCSANIPSQTGTQVRSRNMTINQNQCGCYNDLNGNLMCQCCLNERNLLAQPFRQCPASVFQSNCSCPQNPFSSNNSCTCLVSNQNITYTIPNVTVNQNSNCSCNDITVNNVTTQQCTCCLPRSTLKTSPPMCPFLSSQQQCICSQVQNPQTGQISQVCDCTQVIRGVKQTSYGITVNPQNCSCLNQTTPNGVNSLNCSCCLPNGPQTICQQFALPSSATNSSILNCKCNYAIINGKSQFVCNCSARANATTTITRNQMTINESSCCCTERSDPLTRKNFKACNCTQPAIFISQNCQCAASTIKGSNSSQQVTCTCNDCNSVPSNKTINLKQCQCPPSFYQWKAPARNSTNNSSQGNSTRPTNNTQNNNASNSTQGPNGTRPPVNGTNNTNSTGPTPQPGNNTNGTRGNNTGNNGTVTPQNQTSNSTQNNTRPPTNQTNTTAGNNTTNGTRPTNGTNITNGTQGGNQTNNNITNGTRPANGTSNGTNTNGTRPANGTNITNGTNTTNPTNTTKPANGTNSTTNGTNATNSTRPANGTNSTTNGTVTSNTTRPANGTNQTSNGTNVTNTTRPANGTNSTSNATNNTNTTRPTNGTNATNGTNTANSTNGTRPTNGTNVNNGTNPQNSTNSTRQNTSQTNGTAPNNSSNTNGTRPQNSTNQTIPPNNSTNNSSNNTQQPQTPPLPADTFACSCQVEFAGLCQPLTVSSPLDESTCDLSNVPPSPAQQINTGCRYQYQYLVAVVATGKDSSLLMQLQAYQMQYGQYLRMSIASLLLFTTAILFY